MSTCKCKNNQTDNLKELDEILETYGKKKGYLITILQKAQDAYGYISIDIMNRISEFTGIKVAKIYGVATFYAQFRLQPIGKYLIMLCQGTACHVNGSEMISQVISEQLNIKDGETTEDGLFTLNQVSCLGCCSLAPVMMIKTEDSDETYGNLTKDSVIEILNQIKEKEEKAKGESMKIVVGQGSCGIATGAKKVANRFEEILGEKNIDINVDITGCIGTCFLEPIVDIYEDGKDEPTRYVKVKPDDVAEIVESHIEGGKVVENKEISEENKKLMKKQKRIVLRNCGSINPEEIDEYISRDGYKATEKVLTTMTDEEVIDVIKVSGLRGRGGAGFPTWFKWNAARQNKADQKYIVCNADEGDPGAFMDRAVLEGDPHSLLEGMIIGGYAMGATEGVIYVRAEYPLAIKRLEIAIAQAKERGYLGKNIFGSGFDFDIRIKEGAGAFVCGEETALIASLEGERGMPRLKPPFPAQKGYWQKPTNINNVETYANVAWIMLNGGETFGSMGTKTSNGTKVFALAGKIKKGGLVEVPMGISLREVIYDIGGGIKEDKEFKAVQMGGPSGGCIPASLIDTPVDYENINKTGAIVGSGGMIVMDETTCMVDMARYFLDFTRKESCGKCNYCRIGTKRMLEILERITNGEGKDGDIELLEELAYKVKDGAMCGLGQTAPNPVITTLKYFRHEYEDHIYNKKCTAKSCKSLISYDIVEDKCKGCGACKKKCPVSAISGNKKEAHVIDKNICIKCGKCMETCKFNAIEIN